MLRWVPASWIRRPQRVRNRCAGVKSVTPTEGERCGIGAINGVLCQIRKKYGVDAPSCDTIIEVAKNERLKNGSRGLAA